MLRGMNECSVMPAGLPLRHARRFLAGIHPLHPARADDVAAGLPLCHARHLLSGIHPCPRTPGRTP